MKAFVSLKKIVFGQKVDPDLVAAFRSAIPRDVQVRVTQNGDTCMATITGIEHEPLSMGTLLVTEAKTESELIDMVNDLIFTYKRIPEACRPFYRQALKPEGMLSGSESLSLVRSV
jgi:hypothetical protein